MMQHNQKEITIWCRPVVKRQAGTVPGPHASRGSASATGGSVDLGTRGKQRVMATGQTTIPATALRTVQWNAEGVQKKKQALQAFLKDNNIDVACIQETHLTQNIKFFVRGYDIFRRDRTTGHKGGVLTLVKHGIPAVQTAESSDGDLEYITIKAFLQDEELHITNCYSSPSKKLQLHTLQLYSENHLITGDFNSHSPAWGYDSTDSRGEEIQDWMMDNQLILINKPTDKPSYFSRSWKKTYSPDLALATEDIQKRVVKVVNPQLGGSDHKPITLFISDMKTTTEYCRKRASWNFKKARWTEYKLHAETLCDINFTEDINQNTKLFTAAILGSAKKSIPRGFRKDYKPYWSKTLANLHQKLSEARESMEQDPSAETVTRHNELKEEFNETKVKELQESWHDKTSSLSLESSTGKLWQLVKTLNEDATSTRGTTVLEEEGSVHIGRRAANLLAETFQDDSTTKVSPERREEVAKQLQNLQSEQTTTPQSMSSDFTLAELEDAIKRLRNKKAPGKDGVCNEMIRHLGETAKQKLLELFNQSWTTGIFPTAWKEATIIPILKKGKDPKQKTSYRPISLLSCLGKTLERMVNKRLMWHLETNNLITKEQTAFRKNRNTEDQLIHLAQSIENAFQDGHKVVATFIDLTKAFDKVWKQGLLLKLQTAGVKGKMFKWVKSFLSHRMARVKLNGALSQKVTLKEGVPQGGVISPTLFIVYINDITRGLSIHTSRALHADDFAMWTSAASTNTAKVRMQDALNNTSKWADDWCVTINSLKTVATCFSLSNKSEKIQLKIKNRKVPMDDTPTYLGIKLDKRLTWNPQIQEMEKRATNRLSLMKKLAGTKWGANNNILQQVYTGNVRPVMEYGSAAWATAAPSNTARLDKVQNASMRLITGGLKTTPINTLQTATGLLSLDTRRQEKVLIQQEKLKRIPNHPANKQLQQLTKNRLKRKSFNHLAKGLTRRHSEILPQTPEEREPLQDAEEWNIQQDSVLYATEVPGVTSKGEQPDHMLKILTLEMLHSAYSATDWTRVYTDGSADAAIKNGGSGVFVKYPDGNTSTRSLPAGGLSTNYRAELTALKTAAEMICNDQPRPQNVVFLTDCKSAIQRLQSPKEQLERDTQQLLSGLSQRANVAVQWIPAHCGVYGNEEADRLAKHGSTLEQQHNRVSYREAKTLIKRDVKSRSRELKDHNPGDAIHGLQRHQRVVVFRLRTGHCRLRAHLYRLGLSPTPNCPCETGPHTPEHVLQDCPLHHDLRIQLWPEGATLGDKLWGPKSMLETTAKFISSTGLEV